MDEGKKEDSKEDNKEQFIEKIRGVFQLPGEINTPMTKIYICPNCGDIVAADVLWKEDGNEQKPYCGYCKVVEVRRYINEKH